MNGLRAVLLLLIVLLPVDLVCADENAFFRDSVEPLLKKHCFECHSHSAGVMEGELTLDWQSGWKKGGSRGAAIVPGDPAGSLLIKAVRHSDPDLKMPDEKLPEKEIAILVEWVKKGAHDPRTAKPVVDLASATDWWSLKPLVRPTVPGDGTGNPIDAFIHARLKQEGLTPSPEADQRTLIRRLMYDLHGLHPTYEEVAAFMADQRPNAYENLLERLLKSPRYGERWARHWLDTVHYADTHGFEHDVFRPHAWRYRDYVIDRLNRDIPWAQFIREQLAADHFFPKSSQLTVALGFLGAGPYDSSAAATAPKSFEYLDRDDLVTQTMGAFTSTTANCARCHTHKFDPITQADYFSLQAVFAGIGKGDVPYDADQAVADQRAHWQSVKVAAQQKNAGLLLKPDNLKLVAEWEQSRGPKPHWLTLEPDVFVSTNGATLKRQPDASVLSTGQPPDQETIVVTASTTLSTITAVRLDLLTDDSLPHKGPGRAHNGNLHLSEFELRLFLPHAEEGQVVPIRQATADFNQAGWTIQHALDGNPKTAWGIYPSVGVGHYAVFELKTPLSLEPGSRLAVTLKQIHGGAHIIGRFKLTATDAPKLNVIALPAEVETVLTVPVEQRTPEQQTLLAATVLEHRADQELEKLPPKVHVYAAASAAANAPGTATFPQLREIRILSRGDLEKPREVVGPGALTALSPLPGRFDLPPGHPESARRAALADWLADPKNPLTWRSITNRVWHYHFGKGLCDTPNDFGRMGGTPSHPELLDWLACELRDHNGSLKHLHRLICNSNTYQQSSAYQPQLVKLDPENRLLARMSRQRLDAGTFRDAVLQASGKLDFTMGGPGVEYFTKTPGPQATPVLHYDKFDLDSPGAYRRSIYRVVWRGIADPLMDALDFPDLGLLAPVRGFSASPLQSLVLFNNRFVLHHAQKMAERAEKSADSVSDQVKHIVLWTWLREPTPDELKSMTKLANEHGLATVCRLVLNSNEFLFVE
ncbi:PSD1 and planctomycete cytochrome C domain-containing protein [Gimesia fumaroli]|uniref:Planctomycete cytochrome C n=1 Tax=Gimesia fumaroli TaxID=2527976 RepID=A0A518IE67_9PLAN|nr:PSD1 and planctomycete cytochrome C domain-containing protein [Gimesia fumaroli]QDV51386.1 Planctomycete cytochrome C [Gimesia fumaroli]